MLTKALNNQIDTHQNPKIMVGRGGLEPPTSRLSGVRSNHLSYRPILQGSCALKEQEALVEPRRIELLTS